MKLSILENAFKPKVVASQRGVSSIYGGDKDRKPKKNAAKKRKAAHKRRNRAGVKAQQRNRSRRP